MSLRRGILALALTALATMLAGCGCDRDLVRNQVIPYGSLFPVCCNIMPQTPSSNYVIMKVT